MKTKLLLFAIYLFLGLMLTNAQAQTGSNTTLLKTIADAKALPTDGYPEGAVTTLYDMIGICENIAASEKTQTVYNKYNTALKNAVTSYKSMKGKTFDTSAIPVGEYDTNRGFLHPGMLHTEADFARIRQQISDGNEKVVQAFKVLKSAAYAQSSAATYPVEVIVRGGGSGENYINAARGATIAYLNALRWHLEGNKACAKHAVEVLMAWANTCKDVSGNSNYALAAGLYGYQFANAAELMRDYDGWSKEDFQTFKQWMLTVWYPKAIGFLRGRNGTWENAGRWGECPGHYWSNWGLCNALCVACIGILCDDVFIYNQGMSFFKYDQVGTYKDPRTANPILNDGLTEFLGNLVVTTSEWNGESGAYGKVGQMQESGRDVGHATMALGLAVDLAQIGWNQGDDLFSYMDHRLAAGIEFVAAQQQGITDLPWTTYHYAESGLAWWDSRSWKQETYATGEQIRPYWGTIIGHYEGIKGVKMPFSEWAYDKMGIDAGGVGSTSGGYDHLGYSVLMNTRPFVTEETRPTELKPLITVDSKNLQQSDLGGLKNHWKNVSTETVEQGKSLTLSVVLPEGEEDTGNWLWNTGETTRSITVTANKSYVYRATYTNKNGVKSQQSFSIAVTGDCTESPLNTSLTHGTTTSDATEATVFYGDKLEFLAATRAGWEKTIWCDGNENVSAEIPALGSERTFQAIVTNQGGRRHLVSFSLTPVYVRPDMVINSTTKENQTTLVTTGNEAVSLQPYTPEAMGDVNYLWSDGTTEATLALDGINTSGTYSVTISNSQTEQTLTYNIYINDESVTRPIEPGCYMIRHAGNDTYMTNNGINKLVTFTEGNPEAPAANQTWEITVTNGKYAIKEVGENSGLGTNGKLSIRASSLFCLNKAVGMDRYALYTKVGTSTKYWAVAPNGEADSDTGNKVTDFPFEFIPIDAATGIEEVQEFKGSRVQEFKGSKVQGTDVIYDLQGRMVESVQEVPGSIFIINGKKYIK